MSSHPFPHAITLSQSSSQEFDGSQQPRPDSPPPPPSLPNTNYAMVNPIQHYYSSLISSPQLGSSPQSVVYAPLPSQLEVQSQETQTQLQESLAPPTTSPFSRQKQQALRNTTLRTQPDSQPESHHLLSTSTSPAFQTEHQQILNTPYAPELNYKSIASSTQYAVSTQFLDKRIVMGTTHSRTCGAEGASHVRLVYGGFAWGVGGGEGRAVGGLRMMV
ncbi:uncharacterized protein EAF01_006100 [Botrytis porri]|uniref:uncharacterized protein n=1 Tax=Botrytis porri TaxID=87229 RepID=UPI0018FFBFA2|nr:uncharacterized protein EAF01_006100 [Botrytis porri]KAF7905579.1 hypothetical protein EAF01_006100 [Botrytis porri]